MDKLNQILNDTWAIRAEDLNQLHSFLLPAIKSGDIGALEKHLGKNITAYATSPYICDRWELDDFNLPQNSVAVLNLDGILYSWNTFRLEDLIQQALRNPKICGIVLWINGPGGMVTHVDVVEAVIRTSEKPVAAYVAGICCSAHYWMASACGRIFIASPLCTIGSVGVMQTFCSFKKYYESLGINIRDIYPDTADLKNKEFRDIEDNNDEQLLKERLSYVHGIFSKTIARNLNVGYDPELPLFRGETFLGEVAVANGYAHQMGDLNEAITWVMAQDAIKKASQ